MGKTITELTAGKQEQRILRLAPYTRVSSNSEDQLHSFAAQVKHYTAAGKYRFQLIRLAEFDATGAYAEQAAKIIDNMNGNFIKERFYAIPLESLPRVNSHNAKPRMPFYHPPHTDGQK